jgi:hypothetical protein
MVRHAVINRPWLLLVAGVVAGACTSGSNSIDRPGSDVACTLEARAGINLTAFDSVGGQPLGTIGTVVAQDGNYSEKAIGIPGTPVRYSMAFERAGTYTVTAAVDGYQSWRATGVVVPRDACHVIPVQLTARLVR